MFYIELELGSAVQSLMEQTFDTRRIDLLLAGWYRTLQLTLQNDPDSQLAAQLRAEIGMMEARKLEIQAQQTKVDISPVV